MADVNSLVADARGYVTQVLTPADTALQAAINAVGQIGYTQLTYSPLALPALPKIPAELVAPTLADIGLELPVEPSDALAFQDISAIEAGDAPTFDGTAPTISLPNKPSALAEFQATAPAINTALVFPEPPAALLQPMLDAPTLADRAEPDKPQVMLPVFDAVAPTDMPAAPTDYLRQFEAAYANAAPSMIAMMDGYVDAYIAKVNPNFKPAMTAIETQLQKYLDGGTGLNPAVENAIYERARSKNDAEGRRVRDTAYKDAAARGFTLPPGALLSAVQTARQSTADANAAGAREIVVMQAEYEQKNLQFAVTASLDLRKTILSSALSYHQNLVGLNGQALEYGKTVLSALIEVYNTAVKAFTVRLDVFRAQATVFETRLKAALAAIDLYRAEIAALEAMTQVDRARVEVYRARIEALMQLASVYRVQIEAVQGRASLEKLKIDLFGAQVQQFGALVQAKESEWRGYTAAIQGENAKAELFGTQIRGYVARVEGFKATIDAKAEVVRATATTNQARAENFKAVMSGYNTIVTARGEVARTRLENQRQGVIAFEAKTRAQVANAQIANEYYRSTGEIAIKNAALSIDAIFKSAELARAYSTSIANLHSANATIHGNLASSAMAGMNTLVADTLAE